VKKYRNYLAISLIIILALYFVIFGVEDFWKVMLTHVMFIALFPIFVFVHVFSKLIPLKEDISIETVCETVWKRKFNIKKTTVLLLFIFLSITDFLFDGLFGFIDGWLNTWSMAAAVWLFLLTIYSYQVYINPPNKKEVSNNLP